MKPRVQHQLAVRWTYVPASEDGSLSLTSWRYRYPKPSRIDAEIAATEAWERLGGKDWRYDRLSVVGYRLPLRCGDPIEVVEVYQFDRFGNRHFNGRWKDWVPRASGRERADASMVRS